MSMIVERPQPPPEKNNRKSGLPFQRLTLVKLATSENCGTDADLRPSPQIGRRRRVAEIGLVPALHGKLP
jgi:hypothetical protein